ncbi:Zinc finger, C6HC-type [Corchorus capsularis]|uniref:RBR-type E3 ubiquitin transferase n=1 Tax=Corchorus capsularis TaxID=210143 RepID=A0A1R3J1G0_COCAP|nr:Zinc finger, C6HC-type [Corchorus capsularis]
MKQPQKEESDSCEICVEPIKANNKFNNRNICKHNFCSSCIAKYIEAKVVQFNLANINCPALGCNFLLDPLSCRPIISSHLFQKWCDLLCSAVVLQYYSSNSVYCPNQNCSALIVNECKNHEPTKSSCPNCKNMLCFKCKTQWHAGSPCREKREFSDRNELLTRKLIKQNEWTRCSNCRHFVERNGGYVDMYFAMDVEKQTKLEVECELAATKCVETIYSAISFLLQLSLSFV